jgi:hypothetical protein
MQRLENAALQKAKELLESGAVNRVLGYAKGEFCYDVSPAVFYSVEELENAVYNGFCGANLSKYLIQESKKEGTTDFLNDLIMHVIIFGIIGARLYYVIFNFKEYQNNLLDILKICL